MLLFLPMACSSINNNILSNIQSTGYSNTISETENDNYYKLLLEQVINLSTTKVLNDNNLTLSDVVNVINKRYSKNFSEQHIIAIYNMAKEKKIDIIYIIENCLITKDNKITL